MDAAADLVESWERLNMWKIAGMPGERRPDRARTSSLSPGMSATDGFQNGQFTEIIHELRGLRQDTQLVNPGPNVKSTLSPLLSTVISEFCKEKSLLDRWKPKTIAENEAIYALLLRILGDQTISSVKREHFQDYISILKRLPPNLNKSPRYRRKSIDQILRMPDVEVMAANTISKNVSRAGSLFRWAFERAYTERDVSVGLRVEVETFAWEERECFTDQDLQLIVNAYERYRRSRPKSWQFWLPLLAIYTAARLEELCQLRTEDVVEINGIVCLRIRRTDGRRLKNDDSVRTIPLHSKLIELGFSNFVAWRHQRNDLRLFSELSRGRDGYHPAASKYFARFIDSAGVVRERKGSKRMHSSRHTFINHQKQIGIPALYSAEMAGHSVQGETHGRYGKPLNPKALQTELEKVDYELDFSLLFDAEINPFICPLSVTP